MCFKQFNVGSRNWIWFQCFSRLVQAKWKCFHPKSIVWLFINGQDKTIEANNWIFADAKSCHRMANERDWMNLEGTYFFRATEIIWKTYSLSDSILATAFPTFLWQNVRVWHPNLANLFVALLRVCINILAVFINIPLWSTTTCMYKHHFCLKSATCWFCSLVPIVKFTHCQQLPTIQTRTFCHKKVGKAVAKLESDRL